MIYTLCILLYIIILLSSQTYCDSSFITEESDLTKLLDLLKHKEFSLILIYSPYCPHCRNFAPHYEKLANAFHDRVHFYKMNAVESNSYNKKFKIRGYPSLWFYYNDSYTECNDWYTYDFLSAHIIENYLYECKKITFDEYDKIKEDFYKNKEHNNFIVAFGGNGMIDVYKSLVNETKFYIDNCYYINETNITSVFNNTIISYSKQKGINTFTEFKYNNKNSINDTGLIDNLRKFIRKNVYNYYKNVDGEKNIYDIAVQQKDVVIFSYDSKELYEQYIRNITYLSLLNTNENNTLFDFVLFNTRNNIRYISRMKFGSKGVYLSDRKLSKIEKIDDIKVIEEMIIKNNKVVNITTSTQEQKEIIESRLGSYKKEQEEKNPSKFTLRNILFKLLCLVLYTVIFIYLFRKYNQGNVQKDKAHDEEIKALKDNTITESNKV